MRRTESPIVTHSMISSDEFTAAFEHWVTGDGGGVCPHDVSAADPAYSRPSGHRGGASRGSSSADAAAVLVWALLAWGEDLKHFPTRVGQPVHIDPLARVLAY